MNDSCFKYEENIGMTFAACGGKIRDNTGVISLEKGRLVRNSLLFSMTIATVWWYKVERAPADGWGGQILKKQARIEETLREWGEGRLRTARARKKKRDTREVCRTRGDAVEWNARRLGLVGFQGHTCPSLPARPQAPTEANKLRLQLAVAADHHRAHSWRPPTTRALFRPPRSWGSASTSRCCHPTWSFRVKKSAGNSLK